MRITRPETAQQQETTTELRDWADNPRGIIYVDGTNGDDSGAGSEADPLKTITAGISKVATLQNGADVYYEIAITPGTYNEDIVLEDSRLTKIGIRTNSADTDLYLIPYYLLRHAVVNGLQSNQNNSSLTVNFSCIKFTTSVSVVSEYISSAAKFLFSNCVLYPSSGNMPITFSYIYAVMFHQCFVMKPEMQITNVGGVAFYGGGLNGSGGPWIKIDNDTSLAYTRTWCTLSFSLNIIVNGPQIYVNSIASTPYRAAALFYDMSMYSSCSYTASDYSYTYFQPGCSIQCAMNISGANSVIYHYGGTTFTSAPTIGSEVTTKTFYGNNIANTNIYTGLLSHTIPATMTPTGTTQTVDWKNGNKQVVDLGSASGDVTLTLSNPTSGAGLTLKMIQGATARQLTWPGTVVWEDGRTPLLPTGNDEVALFEFFYDGTSYYGRYSSPNTAPAQKVYVDGTLGNDSYSGSEQAPLKTITAAIAKVAALQNGGATPYTILIEPGTYVENVILEDSRLTNITIASSIEKDIYSSEINYPVNITGFFRSQASNSNITYAHIRGMHFSGAISIEGATAGNSSAFAFYGVKFSGASTFYNIERLDLDTCYAGDTSTPLSITNVVYTFLADTYIAATSHHTLTVNSGLKYPATGAYAYVYMQKSTRATQSWDLNKVAGSGLGLFIYSGSYTNVATLNTGCAVAVYNGGCLSIPSAGLIIPSGAKFYNYGGTIVESGTGRLTFDSGATVTNYACLITKHAHIRGQLFHYIPTTMAPAGTTQTVDWNSGNNQVLDLGSASGDVTLTLSNPISGATYLLKIIQGATARQLTWPGAVVWRNATTPRLLTDNDSVSEVSLFYDGTNYYAELIPFVADANVVEPTGFAERTSSSLAFDNGTRKLTLTASSSLVYRHGAVSSLTGAYECIIPNTDGNHYIYVTGVGGTPSLTSTTSWDNSLMYEPLVAIVGWDATNSKSVYVQDERHGYIMSGATHSVLHNVFGASWKSGVSIGDVSAEGTGNDATDAEFSYSSGVIYDEDIRFTVAEDTLPAQIPIFYLTGAGVWRKKDADNYPVIYAGTVGADYAGTRLPYNLYSGGTWSLAEVTSGRYVLVHYFISPDITHPVFGIVGQDTYTSVISAREAASTEISSISTVGLPMSEVVPLATVIWQTSDSYGNTPKARIRTTDTGDDYLDWRTTKLVGTGGVSIQDHGQLIGLGDDDHMQYYPVDGSRNITGNAVVEGQMYSVLSASMEPSGTTQTVDWDSGNSQTLDLGSASGDVTLTLSNGATGATYVLKIIQGATARDLIWPASVLWPDGITPVISTTNDIVDIVSLFYDGTNYYGSIGQNFS